MPDTGELGCLDWIQGYDLDPIAVHVDRWLVAGIVLVVLVLSVACWKMIRRGVEAADPNEVLRDK